MTLSMEFIVSSVLILSGIIGYIISIERRLTRIETKIDTLLKETNVCQQH